jgi:aminotransferase in exopolysaccharide biosynthesis
MFNEFIQFVRSWYEASGFIPLHAPHFDKLDRKYVLDAIDSTYVSSVGEYVNRFERELAAYVGAKRAVATVNGTSALQVALRLAGVKTGDEVITQPLTFIATVNAIVYNNAHPVFVDVDLETLGLCPDALSAFLDRYAEKREKGVFNKKTGRKVAAIVPMHTFGHPCKMERLLEVADYWQLPIVEDAAEALGSIRKGKHCGTFGKLGIFSFNGNKTITCGGGGAIVTNDEEMANRAKHLTTTAKLDHPWEFIHDEVGYNFRMPNLNAALACAQMEHLDKILADKRKLAHAYQEFFQKIAWADFVSEPEGCRSNYWLNAIILKDSKERDKILTATNKAGVMTRPIWRLMTDLKMFSGCMSGPIQNARILQEKVVNIPSSARRI